MAHLTVCIVWETWLPPAACSFPGENARSWEALGEARPGQSSLSAGALRYRAPVAGGRSSLQRGQQPCPGGREGASHHCAAPRLSRLLLGFLCPWNSPDKNTGVGSQGLNLGLLHHRQIVYCLRHQESHYLPKGACISKFRWNLILGMGGRSLKLSGSFSLQPTPRGWSQARLWEAKDSALLSSRDAGLLEPPERPQGPQRRGTSP